MSEGFPASAIERVNAMRSGGLTTSELSVAELMVVRKAGFRPVGLCLGSCMYHVGFQFSKIFQNQEMTVLSQAMYNARELAMTRMRAEAKAMGVDGIIGVRLLIQRVEYDPEVLEFIAIGTGVVHDQAHAGFKGANDQPFTSHLSGQDFWLLLQSGYRPLDMVMGSCVYHVAHRGLMKTLGSAGQNVELTNYTQATYQAREAAMQRMQAEATAAKAESIVAIALTETSHNWPPHITEFFALGMAVVSITPEQAALVSGGPQLVLPVDS